MWVDMLFILEAAFLFLSRVPSSKMHDGNVHERLEAPRGPHDLLGFGLLDQHPCPVEQIGQPVAPQAENLILREGIRPLRAREHEQLQENHERLEPQRNCPENLAR
jgi:hypothetical protein